MRYWSDAVFLTHQRRFCLQRCTDITGPRPNRGTTSNRARLQCIRRDAAVAEKSLGVNLIRSGLIVGFVLWAAATAVFVPLGHFVFGPDNRLPAARIFAILLGSSCSA